MDAKLAEILRNPHKTFALLRELRSSIEQETECSTMKPERVKNKKDTDQSGRRTLKRTKNKTLVRPEKTKPVVEESKVPPQAPTKISQIFPSNEPQSRKDLEIPKREKAKKQRFEVEEDENDADINSVGACMYNFSDPQVLSDRLSYPPNYSIKAEFQNMAYPPRRDMLPEVTPFNLPSEVPRIYPPIHDDYDRYYVPSYVEPEYYYNM